MLLEGVRHLAAEIGVKSLGRGQDKKFVRVGEKITFTNKALLQ